MVLFARNVSPIAPHTMHSRILGTIAYRLGLCCTRIACAAPTTASYRIHVANNAQVTIYFTPGQQPYIVHRKNQGLLVGRKFVARVDGLAACVAYMRSISK